MIPWIQQPEIKSRKSSQPSPWRSAALVAAPPSWPSAVSLETIRHSGFRTPRQLERNHTNMRPCGAAWVLGLRDGHHGGMMLMIIIVARPTWHYRPSQTAPELTGACLRRSLMRSTINCASAGKAATQASRACLAACPLKDFRGSTESAGDESSPPRKGCIVPSRDEGAIPYCKFKDFDCRDSPLCRIYIHRPPMVSGFDSSATPLVGFLDGSLQLLATSIRQ